MERNGLALVDFLALDQFLEERRRRVGHHLPEVGHLAERVGRHDGVGARVLDLDALYHQREGLVILFDDLNPLGFDDQLTVLVPASK